MRIRHLNELKHAEYSTAGSLESFDNQWLEAFWSLLPPSVGQHAMLAGITMREPVYSHLDAGATCVIPEAVYPFPIDGPFRSHK
jgi:hypothetical protein